MVLCFSVAYGEDTPSTQCVRIAPDKPATTLETVEMQRQIPRVFEGLALNQKINVTESVSVILTFGVGADKQPANIRIIRSSGDERLDQAAVEAIQAAAPYRRQGDCFEITLFYEHIAPPADTVYRAESDHNKPSANTYQGKPSQPQPAPSDKAMSKQEACRQMQEFIRWRRITFRTIQRAWYPDNALAARALVLMLYIDKGGRLQKVNIVRSSGDSALDRLTQQKLMALPVFTRPPAKGDFMKEGITFSFIDFVDPTIEECEGIARPSR